MTDKKYDNGGPAFAVPASQDALDRMTAYETWGQGFGGMSQADWFAGHATCADSDFPLTNGVFKAACKARGIAYAEHGADYDGWIKMIAAFEASICYAKADAMIAEKRRRENPDD